MKKIDGRTKAGKAAKLRMEQWGNSCTSDGAYLDAQRRLNEATRSMVFAANKAPSEPQKTVLQEAHELIHGDRERDYGHPKKNLGDIANFWEMYLHGKYGAEFPIDASDVCQMMLLLKMARGFNGPKKRDTTVDMAGYVGLIERVEG